MRIPLIILPGYRRYLQLQERFGYKRLIVPIGSDCHPAYVLAKLNIRRYSLPFDWLNMEPINSLSYVSVNMVDGFNWFMSDLVRNAQGHIISSRYPQAEFMHEKKLIEDASDVLRMKKRAERLLHFHKERACAFMHTIPAVCVVSAEVVDTILENVVQFRTLIKEGDTIHIYLRHDERDLENIEHTRALYNGLRELDKVSAAQYVRHKATKGIWGDPTDYADLMRSIGLDIHLRLPRILIT